MTDMRMWKWKWVLARFPLSTISPLRSEVFSLELFLAHSSGRVDGYGHGRSGARLLAMMRRARGVRLSPGFGFQLEFLGRAGARVGAGGSAKSRAKFHSGPGTRLVDWFGRGEPAGREGGGRAGCKGETERERDCERRVRARAMGLSDCACACA